MKIIKRDNDHNNMVYSPIRSIFDDFFRFPSIEDTFFNTPSLRSLSADVWEEGDNVFVKMAVPGISEDDLKITVEDDYLTIKAHKKGEDKNDDSKKYYYRSMESSFEQSFNLPSRVDADKSEAKLENGIVTIKLPKTESQKVKVIKINK